MNRLKLKIVTGFRPDQHCTIGIEEAPKAYRLFANPDERAVFDNGTALIGSSVKSIEPDWNATMGWNPTYVMGNDDWNEIRSSGAERMMRDAISSAKEKSFGDIQGGTPVGIG